MNMAYIPLPLRDELRFRSKLAAPDANGCVLYTGGARPNGYGIFSGPPELRDGKKYYPSLSPHRTAWELEHGEIPAGLQVCHRCDVRLCCNPEHLFLGTTQDNTQDRQDKQRSARGERGGNSKLTEAAVLDMRARYQKHGKINLAVLAAEYGVTPTQVSYIVNRLQWTHI